MQHKFLLRNRSNNKRATASLPSRNFLKIFKKLRLGYSLCSQNMLKKILIVIAIVLAIVAVLGIYLVFGNRAISPQESQSEDSSMSFEIQGMKVEILQKGSGVDAKVGDYVTTHYVGTLQDGKEFDSSIKRNVPFTFQLGQNRVIKGWDLGVLGMKVGEKRRLTVPYELAYGADGFPPLIPQKATLIYTIELLGINPSTTPTP